MQAPGFAGINIFPDWGLSIQSRTKGSGCLLSLVMSGHQGDVHSGMTSIPYSWPWSICLSTHGIRYDGGNIQLFSPAQERVNASMPSAQELSQRLQKRGTWRVLKEENLSTVWVKHVVIIVHLSRQGISLNVQFPGDPLWFKTNTVLYTESVDANSLGMQFWAWASHLGKPTLMLSALWRTVFAESFSATDRSTSLTPLSSLHVELSLLSVPDQLPDTSDRYPQHSRSNLPILCC